MCSMCRSNELPKLRSDRDQEKARINAKVDGQLRAIRTDWEAKGITSAEARAVAAMKTVTVMMLTDPVAAVGLAGYLLSDYMDKQEIRDAKIQEG